MRDDQKRERKKRGESNALPLSIYSDRQWLLGGSHAGRRADKLWSSSIIWLTRDPYRFRQGKRGKKGGGGGFIRVYVWPLGRLISASRGNCQNTSCLFSYDCVCVSLLHWYSKGSQALGILLDLRDWGRFTVFRLRTTTWETVADGEEGMETKINKSSEKPGLPLGPSSSDRSTRNEN